MEEEQPYYFLPVEDCLERIESCLNRKKIIKAFIQDRAGTIDAWKSGLMTILCEYYSINCRYVDMLEDLILIPPSTDDITDEEVISVDAQKYAILTSYSKLMIIDEMELKYAHKIHLFIH